METRVLRTRCKVNLFLEITGTRPDGYHELVTLFWPLRTPYDTLTISSGEPGQGLALACREAELAGPDNLAAKAYRAFAERTGFAPDLCVDLVKGVPSGAGLGGGSADAAAMLGLLNELAGEAALPAGELSALAARLGADVPFFLGRGPALAKGVGERLEPVAGDLLTGWWAVTAIGSERVPTAWAYRQWDALCGGRAGRNSFLTTGAATDTEPFCVLGMVVANSFEAAVFPAFPGIRSLKERLYGLGASAAAMSGSGAAVFGLFRDQALAGRAVADLAAGGFQAWADPL